MARNKSAQHTHAGAGCPFPWGAYVARTTPAGAQIETGERRWVGKRRAAGHGADGHGDCELWINCHRVFDLWCLCRFVALCRFSPSFSFPTDTIYSPFPFFPKVIPLFSDATPFFLFFLRFAFVWLIVLDRARFQRAAPPSLSFSFFYNNDLFTYRFSSSCFLSPSHFLPVSLSTTVLITVLTFTDLSLMFSLALTFVPSLCRSSGGKLTTRRMWELSGCQRPYDLGIKIFQSAEVDDRRGSRLPLHHARGCCIINFRSSIRCVRTCKQWS